jgi:hypothetical protein
MHVRTRKFVGAVVLLLFLLVYAMAVASIGAGRITEASPLLQLLYFLLAGFAWVLPAGLLLRWMARP